MSQDNSGGPGLSAIVPSQEWLGATAEPGREPALSGPAPGEPASIAPASPPAGVTQVQAAAVVPPAPVASGELHHTGGGRAAFLGLALSSIGVVYGDIGTSPLYALRESLAHSKGSGLTSEVVVGTVSLLLWALFFTVTAKYVLFLMRARQQGRGRHAVVDGAGANRAGQAVRSSCSFSASRARRSVLGRCDHHAGDLGALRARGPRSGVTKSLRRNYAADAITDDADPGDAVLRAKKRHRARGAPIFGPIMLLFFSR